MCTLLWDVSPIHCEIFSIFCISKCTFHASPRFNMNTFCICICIIMCVLICICIIMCVWICICICIYVSINNCPLTFSLRVCRIFWRKSSILLDDNIFRRKIRILLDNNISLCRSHTKQFQGTRDLWQMLYCHSICIFVYKYCHSICIFVYEYCHSICIFVYKYWHSICIFVYKCCHSIFIFVYKYCQNICTWKMK